MRKNVIFHRVDFDEYALDYDAALAHGLSVSGEDKNYFAQGRMAWLANCLQMLDVKPQIAMDFGCGTGSASPYFFDLLGAESILGIDTSEQSLRIATRTFGSEHAKFLLLDQYRPEAEFDLVFCNGVFHHVPLDARPIIVNYLYRSLKPGGIFSVWENNPFNPGARYVMSRIPFDRDAIMVTPAGARRLLRANDFQILRIDFLFIFPKILRFLRGIERRVSWLPLGAQYQVLARKPYPVDRSSKI